MNTRPHEEAVSPVLVTALLYQPATCVTGRALPALSDAVKRLLLLLERKEGGREAVRE